MLTFADVQSRGEHRAELNRRVLELQRQLVQQYGFTEYREGEWLHPDTARHVRMGYAADEWTITLSDYPEGGYAGVAQLKMAPRAAIRLDARAYARGDQAMPTVEELAALVRQ